MKKLTLPLSETDYQQLQEGDTVTLSGVVYTARDCAHKRIVENPHTLPFDLKGQTIYYAGPCPCPPDRPIGSCGPTTSKRMDAYTPQMLDMGISAAIGKGARNQEISDCFRRHRAVYFLAIGGAGALYGSKVKSCELAAYPDLLSEAVYRLEIEDFPVVVGVK